jgi:DNA-binding NarL/FixJ family response regulator
MTADVLRRAGYETIEVTSGIEALEAAQVDGVSLLVLEVVLHEMTGYEVCRELRESGRDDLGIFFLSSTHIDPVDRIAGLLFGADDFLVKPFHSEELVARVRRFVSRRSEWLQRVDAESSVGHPTDTLTMREREVLRLLALGRTQREIAQQLGISDKTVSSHLQRVLEKLRVHSRAHAVAVAYQDGLVRLGDTVSEPIGVGRT